MTDAALRRADRLLTELVELVETARAVPLSSSCVLPRERMLDLLDELREVMPPEMTEARRLIAEREGLLGEAREAGDATLADARQRAEQLVGEAEQRAYDIVEAGKAEHAQLVSATGVHRSATEVASRLRADGERYAAGLRADAERYADETLADLLAVLQRTAGTAEQGRQALAQRRSAAPQPEPALPPIEPDQAEPSNKAISD